MYAVYPGAVHDTWKSAQENIRSLKVLGHSDVRSKKMHDFERAMLYSRTGSLHDAEHASSAPIRHLYTDGSLQGNVAGCGVYDPDTNLSWSWQLTGNVSSQRAELDAAIRVCQTLTGDLSICTDSQYVVRVLEELIPQYLSLIHI